MEYIPLILSSIVSIVAIVVTAYQSKIQSKTEISKMYFQAQLEAYNNLLHEVIILDEDSCAEKDFRAMIIAGQKAILLSTYRNSKIISHFCATYMEYIEKSNAKKLDDSMISNLKDARTMLLIVLQDEIFRFDTMKRKSDKIIKSMNDD